MLNRAPSLVLIGLSGAGKSAVAAWLGKTLSLPVLEVGSFVRAEAKSKNRNPLEYANDTFRRGGFLHFVTQVPGAAPSFPVIIVGPRRPEEIRYLREKVAPCVVTLLEASFDVRSMRKFGRAQSAGLRHRDGIELSWGFDSTRRLADVTVDAEQDFPTVVRDVRDGWKFVDIGN